MLRPNQRDIQWLPKPDAHNYLAATSYLSLIYDVKTASSFAKHLQQAPITKFKAKDIFRASGLSLLGVSNSNVKKYQKKIKQGGKISPLLLVRDTVNGKVVIADGYHRLCAVYSDDEDVLIPCQIT